MPCWRKEMLPAKRLTLEPSFWHLAGCQTVVGLHPEFWTAEKRIQWHGISYEEKSLLALVMIQLFFQTTNSFGSSLIKSQNKIKFEGGGLSILDQWAARQLVTSSNGALKWSALLQHHAGCTTAETWSMSLKNWAQHFFGFYFSFQIVLYILPEIQIPWNTIYVFTFQAWENSKDPESCAI